VGAVVKYRLLLPFADVDNEFELLLIRFCKSFGVVLINDSSFTDVDMIGLLFIAVLYG
jgi:hypothetical protein